MNDMIKAEFVFPEHLKEFEQRLHGLIEEALNKEITDGITLNGEYYHTEGTIRSLTFKNTIGNNPPLGKVAEHINQVIKTDVTQTSYSAYSPSIEGTFDLTIHNEDCSICKSVSIGFMTNKYGYDHIAEKFCFTEKLRFWKK